MEFAPLSFVGNPLLRARTCIPSITHTFERHARPTHINERHILIGHLLLRTLLNKEIPDQVGMAKSNGVRTPSFVGNPLFASSCPNMYSINYSHIWTSCPNVHTSMNVTSWSGISCLERSLIKRFPIRSEMTESNKSYLPWAFVVLTPILTVMPERNHQWMHNHDDRASHLSNHQLASQRLDSRLSAP